MPPNNDGNGTPGEPLTVFGGGSDDIIPGEVVLRLKPETAGALTVSVPTGPSRGGQGFASDFGVSGLDSVLADLGTRSITAVHTPAPPSAEQGFAVARDFTPLSSTYKVRFDPANPVTEAVERLASLDEVETAEPNRYRESYVIPNDPSYAQQWGLAKINCPEAWNVTTGSPGVTVAVVDTGVDLNHPQLAPLLRPGRDLVDWGPNPAVPSPWVLEGDFAGVDDDPQDEVGHGTHVAGTIACLSNDGTGVAGVTWQCRLLPVRVLVRARNTVTGRVSGIGSSADIAAGIRWAADNGAQVINLSLGGSTDTTVERDAIAYAVGRGVVVVAAMGNDGTGNPSYPAAYPDVIAVGAVDSTDKRAPFSQTGTHIDVAAPGVNVLSTYWDDTYASLSGTSMASPHVAGLAALILSANSALSSAQVGQIIRDTARPLRDDPADPVPNDRYGSGLIDAKAALERARPVPPSRLVVVCPTRTVLCPSLAIISCPTHIVCPTQIVITCLRSFPVLCPTRTVLDCSPVSIRLCPPTLQCGGPGDPGRPLETDFQQYDPYGYDPYGMGYTP
ncbi:S8 family serine peptidase [Streptosporangium sp. NPDC051023]|uniref:peptidase S8 n=1 Tax=Streptosporangium sp. NPDC051023 TaxID=3155410 RepID=UPI00344B478E